MTSRNQNNKEKSPAIEHNETDKYLFIHLLLDD